MTIFPGSRMVLRRLQYMAYGTFCEHNSWPGLCTVVRVPLAIWWVAPAVRTSAFAQNI